MNELLLPIVSNLIRGAVASFGAYLATYGMTVSGAMQDQLVGGALVIVSLALTGVQDWWTRRKARASEVAAAVASAEQRTPVTVTITPAGQPNIATKVSATEAAAAPVVPLGVTPSPAPNPV